MSVKKTEKRFFRIIIPAFNIQELLPRMVESIRRQSCKDYHLIIVDDQSTDDTWAVIQKLKPDVALQLDYKGYAAGARNKGMTYCKGDAYTLWLDGDDELIDDDAFQKIKDCAESHDMPDIIRFNYIKTALSTGLRGNHHDRYPDPITPKDIALHIAAGMPWSKAVKTELCVEFPEDLIIDDCYQHIFQCDVCETAAVIHDDLYEWLVREGSCTTSNDREKDARWYLEIYKLMMNEDELKHSWAKEAARHRIKWIKDRYLT